MLGPRHMKPKSSRPSLMLIVSNWKDRLARNAMIESQVMANARRK